jgi:hypothetical protein
MAVVDEAGASRLREVAEGEKRAARAAYSESVARLRDAMAAAKGGKAAGGGGKDDKVAKHEQEVKDFLLCEDYAFTDCAAKVRRGECMTMPATTIFQCPRACGLCDDQQRFCSDLYLNKCECADGCVCVCVCVTVYSICLFMSYRIISCRIPVADVIGCM